VGILKMVAGKIHNRIRRLRFDADEMTQQDLAELVGVTRQTIVAIEGGKYAPSLDLAFRIALVFNKPLEEVFQYDPERPKPKSHSGRTI
jgi:putative transcriptional regulator